MRGEITKANRGRTLLLLVGASEELVEDVIVALGGRLRHDARLLQQVCEHTKASSGSAQSSNANANTDTYTG